MENMDTSSDSSTLYFYLQLTFIYELGVLVPFYSFEIEFVATINVDSP